MELNPCKSTIKHVTCSNSAFPSQFSLYGQMLESVSSSKYLGVTLNDYFTWNDHIQNRVTSANSTMGFLRRNIGTKDPGIREVAYKTLVHPILEYSTPVWSPYTKSNIHRVEMVQRRAACWTLPMTVFQACWVNLGGGLLRTGIQTHDYVCSIRLCTTL